MIKSGNANEALMHLTGSPAECIKHTDDYVFISSKIQEALKFG